MKKLLIFMALLYFCSCQTELDYKISGYEQKIIVEGYISNDEYPKVYLTLNIPLSKNIDSITVLENVIRTAKVTVSDSPDPLAAGAKTEILTAGWESDKRLFPPFKYYGTDFKGEEGKSYYLTVEIGGYTLKSVTTIPQRTQIVEFKTIPITGSVQLNELYLTVDVNSNLKNSYRIYSKKRRDGYFIDTQVLYNSDFELSGRNIFLVEPKVSSLDNSYFEGGYFATADTIDIRICTIDSAATQFFKALTQFSSLNGMGNNLFIGEKDKLKSNISPPGFGIWYGNGISQYSIVIK